MGIGGYEQTIREGREMTVYGELYTYIKLSKNKLIF